ncbi:MAG: hypothetical protein MHM6MM_003612 [Cercozoa sp. M6MM]
MLKRTTRALKVRSFSSIGDTFRDVATELQRDRELSAVCALVPPACRMGVVAVGAFSNDACKVALTATSAQAAQLRMLWWRTSVQEIGKDELPAAPLPRVLYLAHKRHALPTHRMLAVLQGVADLVETPQAETVAQLDAMCEHVFSNTLYLLMSVTSPEASEEAQDAASLVGRAWGLARLLRGAPVMARARDTCVLPKETLVDAKYATAWRQGDDSEGTRQATQHVVQYINALLDAADEQPQEPVARVLAASTRSFVDCLERRDFSVFSDASVTAWPSNEEEVIEMSTAMRAAFE